MGIPDHLTCLLRNLYAGPQATVRTGRGTTYWFQIEKGVCQGCIWSSCLFNLYAEYIMPNARWDESQAGIKIAREISITSDMQRTPLRVSFPRQVDKKSRGYQGERGLEFSRRKKGQTFFPLYSLGLCNNNVSCLRTVSGLNLLANPVILKCKLCEKVWWGLYNLQTFFWFIDSFCPLLMSMSGAFSTSFILLIKPYYTKALSDQGLSLAPVRILLKRPRTPVSLHDSATTFHPFANKGPYSQSYSFASSHVQI